MERLKSKLLWGAIIAQVISILILTNNITIAESEVINSVVASVLQILTLIGVLNNPQNPTAF